MSKLLNSFLGPFGQLIGIPDLRVSENSRCIVTFNGSIDVVISTSAKDEYLQIESSIFEDVESIDRDMLILMLGVNHNAQLVSDSIMALDEQRGSIVLLRRKRIHLLEYPTFLNMMEEFPNEVRAWRSKFNQIIEKTIRNELERGKNFDTGNELTIFRA